MKSSERGRLHRMRDVYEADKPSDFEVHAALSRYRARKSEAKRRGGLWLNFTLGFAGMGVLLSVAHFTLITPSEQPSTLASKGTGAAAEPDATDAIRLAEQPVNDAETRVPAGAATHHELAFMASIVRGAEETRVQPGTFYVVEEGESVEVHTGGEVQRIRGPVTLEFQLDPDRASGWRMVITPGESEPDVQGSRKRQTPAPKGGSAVQDTLSERLRAGRENQDRGSAAPSEAEQRATWTEAAEALRAGDNDRAQDALARLGQSDSVQTRDSAQLTLAQLRLAEGRRDEARAILGRLVSDGATPFIRRRASELMSQ